MYVKIKKLLVILTVCLTVFAMFKGSMLYGISVSADESYDVYNYDRWGEAIPSQAGYLAERNVSGLDLKIGNFSAPSDIFRDHNGLFYIADSGNNRIVVMNEAFDKVVEIMDTFSYDGEKLTLKNPRSIFVSDDDIIYIADTDNSRIIRCDRDCNADLLIQKPVSELYPEELTFLPQRVIADKAGYIYVVVNNITSGSVMYNENGEFTGFYGANRVEKTSKIVWNYFWKLIATDNMRKYMKDSVPAPITSFDIDEDGFIYTCSNSLTQELDSIKKVNAAGYNLFADIEVYFGDAATPDYSNFPKNAYIDVDVSDDGLINCLDYATGRVFQYDEDCNLLFITGSSGNQLGTFRQASAVESSDGYLYVADSQKNVITVFSETVFGSIVHEATRLYNNGYYEEALEPWYEVLKRDGNYRRAYIGIASAMINSGNYSEAMKYAKLADSQWRYNRAFEGWRTEFINENFAEISVVAVIIIVAVILTVIIRKKKKVPEMPYTMELSERQWVKHVVFHPFEGYENLRWRKAGSLKIALIIVILMFIGLIVSSRLYAFHFWKEYDKLFNIVPYIVRSIGFFAAWIIGNWSVCTLLSGEGKLRNICIYSAYALIPYVVMQYATTILSHFLTNDEGVFLVCVYYLGLGWSCLLMFNAIKAVHQYSAVRTVFAIALTIAAMLIIMFLMVLLLSLFQKVILFAYSIYTEIQYRIKV